MKKLLFMMFLLFAVPVHAVSLTPTDGTVDIFDLTALTGDPDAAALFAIIQAGSDPNDTVRIPLNFDAFTGQIFPITGDQVNFTPVSQDLGGGFAFGTEDGTIIIPAPEIEVVYFDSQNWVGASAWEQNGPASVQMTFNDRAGLLVSDVSASVAAVPVPPAAWLFGSGLLGLCGVARRNNP